jgi:hypothetical protein
MSHGEPWERDPGGLVVCMVLERISSPFGSPIPEAQVVELKFSLSPCHGLEGFSYASRPRKRISTCSARSFPSACVNFNGRRPASPPALLSPARGRSAPTLQAIPCVSRSN